MNRVFGLCLAAVLALTYRGLAVSTSGTATAAVFTCAGVPAVPVDPYPGATAVATSFGSGTLAGFNVFTSGTGTANVSVASAHTPVCGAFLHTTTDPGSVAKMSVGLAPGTAEVYADGWFNIAAEGTAGSDVPFFRFFSGATRIVDVLRKNATGDVVLRVSSPKGYLYAPLVPNVRLGAWHHLVMHVVPDGPATGVQIWWDGKSAYANHTVNITATTLDMVQLGSEHDRQRADIYADDLIINSRSGDTSPLPGPLPSPAPNPTGWMNDLTGDTKATLTAGNTGRPDRSGQARLRPAEWWSLPRHRAGQFSDYAAVSSGSKIASSTGSAGAVFMALSSAMDASER